MGQPQKPSPPRTITFLGWLVAIMLSLSVAATDVEVKRAFRDAAPVPLQWLLTSISRLIAAAAGAGLMVLGGTLMIDEWPVALAGAPLPSGLKFAGLCVGGALILLFSIERLLTGDYRAPDVAEKAED